MRFYSTENSEELVSEFLGISQRAGSKSDEYYNCEGLAAGDESKMGAV